MIGVPPVDAAKMGRGATEGKLYCHCNTPADWIETRLAALLPSAIHRRGRTIAELARPQGIRDVHLRRASPRWLRPLALWVLVGLPVALGASGLLGGGPAAHSVANAPEARFAVETQGTIRSGNWFETRIAIEPRSAVTDLTLAIDDPLWRRMSIDTFEPQAEKAEYADGAFRYSFGPAKAGEPLAIKIDGQIQSWGLRRLEGRYRLFDGERELASVPVAQTVLP